MTWWGWLLTGLAAGASWLRGRFSKLGMIWCILRGHPVAYRVRIENGGFVIDGSKPGAIVQCQVIGAAANAYSVKLESE